MLHCLFIIIDSYQLALKVWEFITETYLWRLVVDISLDSRQGDWLSLERLMPSSGERLMTSIMTSLITHSPVFLCDWCGHKEIRTIFSQIRCSSVLGSLGLFGFRFLAIEPIIDKHDSTQSHIQFVKPTANSKAGKKCRRRWHSMQLH